MPNREQQKTRPIEPASLHTANTLLHLWNKKYVKAALALTMIGVLVTGCGDGYEQTSVDPGGNLSSPTATEMAPLPTMTATFEPTTTPTMTATFEPTLAPTIEPTKIPKGLPERWDDAEVMARVQEKFEANRALFDQIEAGTLIYHDRDGKEINVKNYMQGYYYYDSSLTFRNLMGDNNIGAGGVGKQGLLLTHECLQYAPDMNVEVGSFVFYNSHSKEKPYGA